MSVIIKGKNLRKPHTVRYWVDGRQKERSFGMEQGAGKVADQGVPRAALFSAERVSRPPIDGQVATRHGNLARSQGQHGPATNGSPDDFDQCCA